MNKCEWKDGKFEGCDNFNGELEKDVGPTSDSVTFRCLHCHTAIQKPEPKQPSHSEIWSKCWKNGDLWVRVTAYENGLYWIFDKDGDDDTNEFTSVGREWFIGVESRDIPPEGE